MAFIEWDDGVYSVGIAFIDEQHKVLVGLINALHKHMADENPSPEFIEKIMNTLISYTENHFKDEEMFLKNIGFPYLEAHSKQHNKFTDVILTYKDDFSTKPNKKNILNKLLEVLKDWLMNHILEEDKAYTRYIHKGVTGTKSFI